MPVSACYLLSIFTDTIYRLGEQKALFPSGSTEDGHGRSGDAEFN